MAKALSNGATILRYRWMMGSLTTDRELPAD
jgi:hypothetical protein